MGRKPRRGDPSPPPRKLTPQAHAGFALLLPLCAAAVTAGALGMLIVLDQDGTSQLSRSTFGFYWRKAVEYNPFFQAFFLNFGAIGFVYCIVRMVEHRKALRADDAGGAAAAAGGAAGTAESRKDK